MRPLSKQQIGKHASTKIELFLDGDFLRSVVSGYKEFNWGYQLSWELKVSLWREDKETGVK
jgi:hypothetical protein